MNPDGYTLSELIKILGHSVDPTIVGAIGSQPGINGIFDDTGIPAHQYGTDYVIRGEMILASSTINSYSQLNIPKDEIKKQLAIDLAVGMIQRGLVEFTQQKNPDGTVIVRARAFAVPNADVQTLRLVKR